MEVRLRVKSFNMAAITVLAVLLLSLLPLLSQAQDMTLLLKQAADGLLVNSLPGFGAKAAAARLPLGLGQPAPSDLAIRRLQVGLALLVEDNWKELTEPQRWTILQSQGKKIRPLQPAQASPFLSSLFAKFYCKKV